MTEERRLAQHNLELSLLNAIAADLNRELDLGRALEIALEHIAALVGRRTGWVWLLNDEGDAALAASCRLPPALACNPERMDGDCTCLDTYRNHRLDDPSQVTIITCSRLKGLIDGTLGLRFHASVPLYSQNQLLGVLNVASIDWEQLSHDELRLLSTVGDLLGIVVERARLFARTADLAALEERNRIAREIHDTLAQSFAAITLKLEVADTLLETGAPANAARARLAEALELARRGLDDARRSVFDLRDDPLAGRGLAASLRALAAGIETAHGFPITLDVTGDDRHIPSRSAAGLFRIAQEALANAIRHANATQIGLSLSIASDHIELSIADNGCGFDPARRPHDRFGIPGMSERARLLGGRLWIESAPDQGTAVWVETPL